MRFWIAIAVAFWGAVGSAYASALPTELPRTKPQTERLFLDFARDNEALREFAGDYLGLLPPAHRELFLQKFAEVLQITEFADRVFDRAPPVYRGGDLADWRRYTLELALTLQTEGLRRLPVERQLAYLKHSVGMGKWLQALSPAACGGVLLGDDVKAEEMRKFEILYLGRVSLDEARSVLDLRRDAMVAELRESPALPGMVGDTGAARTAMEAAIRQKMTARPDGTELLAAFANLKKATPAQVCSVLMLVLEMIPEFPEPGRGWALQDFLKSRAK